MPRTHPDSEPGPELDPPDNADHSGPHIWACRICGLLLATYYRQNPPVEPDPRNTPAS